MIDKTVFMFPGQGSQKVGMGKDLAENYKIAKSTFEEADDILKMKISELCFSGDEEKLKQTKYTQLAVFTVSLAIFRVLQENEITPSAVAGHSLGEYSALVASDVLSFVDALELIQKRAYLMKEAAEKNPGGMVAVLGLDSEQIEEVCHQASSVCTINVANYNCPGQIVISGEFEALELATELAEKMGAKRCIPLAVSGAFHSELMLPAEDGMKEAVTDVEFNSPEVKFVQNVTGDYVCSPEIIRQNLVSQITSSVKWESSMSRLISDGFSLFVEVGPGKVLSGLLRRINQKRVQDIQIYSFAKILNLIRQNRNKIDRLLMDS